MWCLEERWGKNGAGYLKGASQFSHRLMAHHLPGRPQVGTGPSWTDPSPKVLSLLMSMNLCLGYLSVHK